jgi:hypothetical protein
MAAALAASLQHCTIFASWPRHGGSIRDMAATWQAVPTVLFGDA